MSTKPPVENRWEPIEGYFEQRWLPDGRFVGIRPLTFGRARICIGDQYSIFDSW